MKRSREERARAALSTAVLLLGAKTIQVYKAGLGARQRRTIALHGAIEFAEKIGRVERGDALQCLEIRNSQEPILQDYEFVRAQLLYHSIHVNPGQAERVCKIRLSERPLAAVAVRESHSAQPQEQFANQVGDSFKGSSLCNVDHPLALDRAAQHRLAPKGARQIGVEDRQFLESSRSDFRKRQRRQRRNRVAHSICDKEIEMAYVTRKEERRNLPAPILEIPGAASPTVLDQVENGWCVAFLDQAAMCGNCTAAMGK